MNAQLRTDFGNVSDGYHTFNELYEHRHMLFLVALKAGAFVNPYVLLDHLDGWDLITAFTGLNGENTQISYHLPVRLREHYDYLPRHLLSEHTYDGHDSNDVLKRLKELL